MNKKAKTPLKNDQMLEEYEYLKDIIAVMPGHVYWKDKDGIFLGCNLQQAKDAGLESSEDYIGKNDYEMPWKAQAEDLRKMDLEVMRTGIVQTAEEPSTLADGTTAIFLSKKVPHYNNKGEIVGIIGISFDITQQKLLQEELRQAKEQAIVALKAKQAAETESKEKSKILDDVLKDLNTERYYLNGKYKGQYLTKREAECLLCWANGLSAKQVGTQLSISPKTVELYLSNIKNKFNCRTRAELITFAVEARFLDGIRLASNSGSSNLDNS